MNEQPNGFNHIARHLAAAIEEDGEGESNEGKIIEVPGNAASPEVIEKLRSMGVTVQIANRRKRRGIRARQRKGKPGLPPPKVYADGLADPEYKRKQRNKAKAARRKRR